MARKKQPEDIVIGDTTVVSVAVPFPSEAEINDHEWDPHEAACGEWAADEDGVDSKHYTHCMEHTQWDETNEELVWDDDIDPGAGIGVALAIPEAQVQDLMDAALDEEEQCESFCVEADDRDGCFEQCIEMGYAAFISQDDEPTVSYEEQARQANELKVRQAYEIAGTLDLSMFDLAGVDLTYTPKPNSWEKPTGLDLQAAQLVVLKELAPLQTYIAQVKSEIAKEDWRLKDKRKRYLEEIKQRALVTGTWPKFFQSYPHTTWVRCAAILNSLVTTLDRDTNRELGIYVEEYEVTSFISVAARGWRLALKYPNKAGLDVKQVILQAFSIQTGFFDTQKLNAEQDPTIAAGHIAEFIDTRMGDGDGAKNELVGLLTQFNAPLRIAFNMRVDKVPAFDSEEHITRMATEERRSDFELAVHRQMIGR